MAYLTVTPAVLHLQPHWFVPVLVILVLLFLVILGLAVAYMWRIHSLRKEQRCVRRARLAQTRLLQATHAMSYDEGDDAAAREMQEQRLAQMYLASATPAAHGSFAAAQEEVFDEETLTGDAAVADRLVDDDDEEEEENGSHWQTDSEQDYVVRSVLPDERAPAPRAADVSSSGSEAAAAAVPQEPPQTREGVVVTDEVHEIPRRDVAKASVNSLDQYIWG